MDHPLTKQQGLIRYIENEVFKASQPWTAPIYCSVSFVPIAHTKPEKFSMLDIVQFMKSPLKQVNLGFVYFNPTIYPYTEDKIHSSLVKLTSDLLHSARQNGFEIICNGQAPTKDSSKVFPVRFRCSCCRVAATPRKDPTDFRSSSYHNDKKGNARTDGKKQCRKGETKLASAACNFSFQLLLSQYEFYMKAGFGKAQHSNHPGANNLISL